ncbi:hypothetical protein [Haloarchaeobius sp. DFWS5]|uniref:hypothetical protein n=1 Tax=Haloarchaeobius sp. DFWS5 TaxID=3446114 RepID=UPI003EB8A8F0
MNEPTVFKNVLTELEKHGYDCLVHFPTAHAEDYESITESYDRHQITIAGRYPDIIGFTPSDAVFTVEVKGSSNILKGIGQAVTYKRGSHQTYLAAPESHLEPHIDHLAGHGIGGLAVSPDGDVARHEPRGNTVPAELTDVQGRLTYQLRHDATVSNVSTVALAQPLNFFAPVFVLSEAHVPNRDELAHRIESEFGFSATAYAIQGARMLNLIQSNSVSLTEQGELAMAALEGVGVRNLDELKALKSRTHGSVVAVEEPAIATLLRSLYRQHPDFRLLLEAVQTLEAQFTLPTLLEELVKYYPNVFLNLVCRQQSWDTARELIESGERQQLYSDRDVWEEVLHSNFISNFVQQLKHIGVLSPEVVGHAEALGEYDPQTKPWIVSARFSDSEPS